MTLQQTAFTGICTNMGQNQEVTHSNEWSVVDLMHSRDSLRQSQQGDAQNNLLCAHGQEQAIRFLPITCIYTAFLHSIANNFCQWQKTYKLFQNTFLWENLSRSLWSFNNLYLQLFKVLSCWYCNNLATIQSPVFLSFVEGVFNQIVPVIFHTKTDVAVWNEATAMEHQLEWTKCD